MSADRIAAMAATYRNCAHLFGSTGDVVPMVAHLEAASLLDMTALAIREAELSAHDLEWKSVAVAVPSLTAFYQPRARQVAVWCGGQLVEFSEDEAEAMHAALGDALAIRSAARAYAMDAEGLAA